ncbi:MAG TPA: hypothetical protein VGM54_11520 [Chthoniobacter sp.]|jgi:hypothetical protein
MRKHPWLTLTIAIIGLVALFYFGLDWLMERRWRNYEQDAHGRRVKLLLTDYATPPIPDDRNFAALPMMRAAFASAANPFTLPLRPNTKSTPVTVNGQQTAFNLAALPPSLGDPIRGERIDWTQWRKYFEDVGFLKDETDDPAKDVLRALDHYAPPLQEWEQWGSRPECRFPLDFTQGITLSMSHLSLFQGAAKILGLRLRAHLATGNPEAAFADFEDSFQGYRALKDEPSLISGLVRISILALVVNEVGGGLQEHQWPDAILQRITAELATVRTFADYRFALNSERGAMNVTFDSWIKASVRERRRIAAASLPYPGSPPAFVFEWLPRSVFRANQLQQNFFTDELVNQIDADNLAIDPDRATPSSPLLITGTVEQSYYFLCRESASVTERIRSRYMTMQTRLDETRLACALERFYLAHGTYPGSLTELVPAFIAEIPPDVYARAPYLYQPVGKSSFRLYGVGENRKDDGGHIDPKKSESRQLDAVWLFAPPEAK